MGFNNTEPVLQEDISDFCDTTQRPKGTDSTPLFL